MGVSQYFDAAEKMKEQPKGADDPVYKPPRGHDIEMSASERESLCKNGKVRHGQDALGSPGKHNSEASYYHRVKNRLEF